MWLEMGPFPTAVHRGLVNPVEVLLHQKPHPFRIVGDWRMTVGYIAHHQQTDQSLQSSGIEPVGRLVRPKGRRPVDWFVLPEDHGSTTY